MGISTSPTSCWPTGPTTNQRKFHSSMVTSARTFPAERPRVESERLVLIVHPELRVGDPDHSLALVVGHRDATGGAKDRLLETCGSGDDRTLGRCSSESGCAVAPAGRSRGRRVGWCRASGGSSW